MSYIGVKINSLIEKVAGMPLMDVAFSNRSTNGLQNKIITAKKDEIEGRLDAVESALVKYVDVTAHWGSSGTEAICTLPTGINALKVVAVNCINLTNRHILFYIDPDALNRVQVSRMYVYNGSIINNTEEYLTLRVYYID